MTAATNGNSSGDQDLEDFFENGALALHLVASDGTILRANRAELALLGYEREEYIGRNIADFHVDAAAADDILARLHAGQTVTNQPARLRARNGTIKHVLISSSAKLSGGEFVNSRCFTVDVTERTAMEDALRRQEQRLSATYEHAGIGISETDANGRIIRVNNTLCAISGYSRQEMLGTTFYDNNDPDFVESDLAYYSELVSGRRERYAIEKRGRTKDGRKIWMAVTVSAVRDEIGRFLFGVRVVQDITEAKLAQSRREALRDELDHRVKNTLTIIQGLAAQCLRRPDVARDAYKSFDERLMALGRLYIRLSHEDWEAVDLHSLIEDIFAPYGTQRSEIVSIDGPALMLRPRAAQVMSMVLHELATNAAKYGALSTPSGALDMAWEFAEGAERRDLRIRWQESGKPIAGEPMTRGFGLRFVTQSVTRELNGTIETSFDPGGFRCQIDIPVTDLLTDRTN